MEFEELNCTRFASPASPEMRRKGSKLVTHQTQMFGVGIWAGGAGGLGVVISVSR